MYRVIDNELREIADLDASVKKLEVLKPKQRGPGYKRPCMSSGRAYAKLKALYRGNLLYYSLTIYGLNDLRDDYGTGSITLEFIDEYGFILHSSTIPTNELTRIVNDFGETQYLLYNGKTEISTDIKLAIKKYPLFRGSNKSQINV